MSKGTMSSNGNYPSNAGIQVDGVPLLGGFSAEPHIAVLSISGVPGTGASYIPTTLIEDADGAQWGAIKGASLSGNGAAATGQIVFPFTGQAIRLEATNGSSPGTGNNTPAYVLEVFPRHEAIANGLLM